MKKYSIGDGSLLICTFYQVPSNGLQKASTVIEQPAPAPFLITEFIAASLREGAGKHVDAVKMRFDLFEIYKTGEARYPALR